MLVSLMVKNLALIESAEVTFGKGLNILSGETGAGKSILMGSVNMALGGKVSRDVIRTGADYAYAELTFTAEPAVQKCLADLDIYPEDGVYVFSRKLMGTRSICRINGESCSAAVMKQAGEYLLDIHGQNENQTLMKAQRQLELVDAYAGDAAAAALAKVQKCYAEYQSLRKEWEEETMDAAQLAREVSFAQFEVQEIQDAALRPGEDEELEEQYRKLTHAKSIAEALETAYAQTGYDSGSGAGEAVGRAVRALSGVIAYDKGLEGLHEQLMTIDSLLNDFNRELQDYADAVTFGQEDFYTVEERLNLINHLKDKYGSTIEKIQAYCQEKESYLEKLASYETYRQELKAKTDAAEKKLAEASKKLSGIRQKAAAQFATEVRHALEDLNFPAVCFEIRFETLDHYTAGGTDGVTFYISTNPGQPARPLKEVASGGELSRIMLAVKAVLADRDAIGTQIFDEIDAGISGRTAQKVSEKLSVIAGRRQVICITHLPQIAAMADAHFLIEKQVEAGSTHTVIRALDHEEETVELARMLGGVRITDAVLQNAREMKELADRTKNNGCENQTELSY